MKKAYKRLYDFAQGNPEKYLMFLKEHFTKTKPTFYSIANMAQIDTKDGIMYAVDLVDDIENPNHDIIAECFINGQAIFLWNNHCWGVAIDKYGREISHSTIIVPGSFKEVAPSGNKRNKRNKRTALLFKIGLDPVE